MLGAKKRRWSRGAAITVVIAAIASLGVAQTAFAAEDKSPDVSTDTTITAGGGGSGPVVECAWAIPDNNNTVAGFQYAGSDDDNVSQDAVSAATAAPGLGKRPCFYPGTSTVDRPTQVDGATKMIQFRPYAHDWNATALETNAIQTTQTGTTNMNGRLITVWTAVDLPSDGTTITSVSADVKHPDGTPKFQVYGANQPCSAALPGNTMWTIAQNTGQVDANAITNAPDNHGMYDLCTQGTKAFYTITFPVSKEQMCGQYSVTVNAVSSGGSSSKQFFFDVLCFIHLEADFTAVHFGNVAAGGTKVIDGNLEFNTANSSGVNGGASVRNSGNTGMQVGVRFFRMVLPNNGFPKYINDFDAKFKKTQAGIPESINVHVNDAAGDPSADGWFGLALDQVLCANEVGKLDLSVHPLAGSTAGIYTGHLMVIGSPTMAPGSGSPTAVCANDVAAAGAAGGDTRIFSDDDPTESTSNIVSNT